MKESLKTQLIEALNTDDYTTVKKILDQYKGSFAAKYLVDAVLDCHCTVPLSRVKTLLEKT